MKSQVSTKFLSNVSALLRDSTIGSDSPSINRITHEHDSTTSHKLQLVHRTLLNPEIQIVGSVAVGGDGCPVVPLVVFRIDYERLANSSSARCETKSKSTHSELGIRIASVRSTSDEPTQYGARTNLSAVLTRMGGRGRRRGSPATDKSTSLATTPPLLETFPT